MDSLAIRAFIRTNRAIQARPLHSPPLFGQKACLLSNDQCNLPLLISSAKSSSPLGYRILKLIFATAKLPVVHFLGRGRRMFFRAGGECQESRSLKHRCPGLRRWTTASQAVLRPKSDACRAEHSPTRRLPTGRRGSRSVESAGGRRIESARRGSRTWRLEEDRSAQ